MSQTPPSSSAGFRLDVVNERLWRGEREIALRPKSFAVLRYLLSHRGRLVRKEELRRAVWPDVVVSDTVLRVCVREIRAALGDPAEAPRLLETVGRRGYRFAGAVDVTRPDGEGPAGGGVVGRDAELTQLRRWLAEASIGSRRVVFVTGEAGIGKTALMDCLLDEVRTLGTARIGWGQCLERYGEGEPYLPMLDLLARLCREPRSKSVVEVLSRHAPSWLVHLPALLDDDATTALRSRVPGATRERMLRELAEALEVLTAATPLVLVVEDLHWSDVSTLELIAFLAKRRERARLLTLGTYRPASVVASGHPLRAITQELRAHGQCEDLRLELLTRADAGEFLQRRLGGGPVPTELIELLHARTDGNPLFMVNVVDYGIRQGLLTRQAGQWRFDERIREAGVPDSLRQLIDKQIDGLPKDAQRVLEVAAVTGVEFRVAAVADALGMEPDAVEQVCEDLARTGRFLGASGVAEEPDGAVTGRYRFLHTLYQQVWYDRVVDARRVRLHRRIGEREEARQGPRAVETAAALAVHFEQGRDVRRAVQYREHAAENALRRGAHQEAILHLERGLVTLERRTDAPDRQEIEVSLRIALGDALIVTRGFSDPEAEAMYRGALALCSAAGHPDQPARVVADLRRIHFMRSDLPAARALAEEQLRLARDMRSPIHLARAHFALGETALFFGEFALAREHLEAAVGHGEPLPSVSGAPSIVQDPAVACLARLAATLEYLGYRDQAVGRIEDALTRARGLAHPFTLAFALFHRARFHQFRGERVATRLQAEALIALASEHGFPNWVRTGKVLQGWALSEPGAIAEMRRSMADLLAMGTRSGRSHHLAVLAEALGHAQRPAEGLAALDEAMAFVAATGERHFESELFRLRGELLRPPRSSPRATVSASAASAAASFLRAIEIARHQGARTFELRAALSLSRLRARQGTRTRSAHRQLAEAVGWFTEGFETTELKESRALLAALA